jgi:hypothetical protein
VVSLYTNSRNAIRVGDSRFFPTTAWLFNPRGERGGGSKPGLQRLWKRYQVVLELHGTASISREQHSGCGCKLPLRATGIAKAACTAKATGNHQRPGSAKSTRELSKARESKEHPGIAKSHLKLPKCDCQRWQIPHPCREMQLNFDRAQLSRRSCTTVATIGPIRRDSISRPKRPMHRTQWNRPVP